jgi:hypothetical protein
MKKETNDSILFKLKSVLPKIKLINNLPVYPVISRNGEDAIDSMIKKVLNDIISSDTKAINRYLDQVKADFKVDRSCEFSTINIKLKKHEANKKLNLFEGDKKLLCQVQDMDALINALSKVSNEGVLSLSTNGLSNVKLIVPIYSKSNEIAKNHAPTIANLFDTLISYETKINNLQQDLSRMNSDWDYLKGKTTPNEAAKVAIIIGGVVGGIALTAATGGAAAIAIGALAAPTAIAGVAGTVAAAVGITETAVLGTAAGVGGVATVGTIIGAAAGAKACNAYENDHPEVKPRADDLRNLFKKIPKFLGDIWLADHNPEKSEYLPDLKSELLGISSDLNSEYSEIFG